MSTIIKIENTAESIVVEHVDLQRTPGKAIRIGALRHCGEYQPDGEPVLRPIQGMAIQFTEQYLDSVIEALVSLRNGKEEIEL